MALHVWRIHAALAFYYFGSQGLLPPLFVILAGTGDLIAGVLALYVVTVNPASRRAYTAFHVIGMADFIVAVGTGLTFSLLSDARMETIALFPLALIPLFGVTVSGAARDGGRSIKPLLTTEVPKQGAAHVTLRSCCDADRISGYIPYRAVFAGPLRALPSHSVTTMEFVKAAIHT